MATGKFVSYCRVSTAKQGASGLGLEAQQETIRQYLNGGEWELIKEFVEVESGKNNDRPELAKALKRCQLTGATLLVAKLDRLSRDIHFITSLEKAGIEFTVCDFPTANKFTIHIFAALAQYERELISQRTKAALGAKKARGAVLGKPENLTRAAADQGREKGRKAKLAKADQFAVQVGPTVQEYRTQGMSLNSIATKLNAESILTASGKQGTWTPTAVKNLLARL
jgi:DNA invertase Pin-like site-specific DNA recombinase